ncbi:MAG TPA: DUF4062 domain-containing protein [Pyrinomonadaceae bacterium]|jgi:hypothetical protein
MAVKYQVFISSTYEDLKAEREQVIKATLEMGHIPVGMEMFSAADEEQWKLITRQIDQSDYYVVIVAHRYGSVVDGVSFTEKEYDYAVHKGVPVIGFVIDNSAPWPSDKIDLEQEKKGALDRFKEKVRRKPVGFWSIADDLYGKFSIALMKLINTNPRPGWAPANEVVGPEVMMELSRLSSENATLRRQLEEALNKVEEDRTTKRVKTIQTLLKNKIDLHVWLKGASEWGIPYQKDLYYLFFMLGPELLIEKSTNDASIYLGNMVAGVGKARAEKPVPLNALRLWLSDLMALGLVMPSPRKHSVHDKNEYWTLTSEGHEVLAMIRRQKLESEPALTPESSDKSIKE